MIRRTRRSREIPFSFDSFLDLVANIVGIIIRLILVVWVSARSYSSVKSVLDNAPAGAETASAALPTDPMEIELAKERREMEEMQARLLAQLRDLQLVQDDEKSSADKLDALALEESKLEQEKANVERATATLRQNGNGAALTLAELRERKEKVMAEIQKLEKLPPLKKVLRYRTPVSQEVKTDEFFFECKNGRVTFVDISSLMADAMSCFRERMEELRQRSELQGSTRGVGAFRLQYNFQLAPSYAGAGGSGVTSRFLVEPMVQGRGESVAEAMATGSQFRQVVDRLDPKLATATFWVYPDSFGVYRQLRDFLYQREIVVAGRPLCDGMPIGISSAGGSASRGQ